MHSSGYLSSAFGLEGLTATPDQMENLAREVYTKLERFSNTTADCWSWFWGETRKHHESCMMADRLKLKLIFKSSGNTYSFIQPKELDKSITTRAELLAYILGQLQLEKATDNIVKGYRETLQDIIKSLSLAQIASQVEHTEHTPVRLSNPSHQDRESHRPSDIAELSLGLAYDTLDDRNRMNIPYIELLSP